jgi:hypothetical protein
VIEQMAESVVVADRDAASCMSTRPSSGPAVFDAEVVGRNPRILQSGLQSAEFYAGMWSTLSGGATWTGEVINRRRDGSTYVEEASITPVVDASGELASYVAVQRDVTHLREVETTLEDTTRKRARVAETLARLQPGDTLEATGQAIADALFGLEGMDSPSVFVFDERGRALVLGRAGGRTGPIEVGGTHADRSAYLRRARTAPGPNDGPRPGREYGARFVLRMKGDRLRADPGRRRTIRLLAVGTTVPALRRLAEQLRC